MHQLSHVNNVVIFTGHLIDAADRNQPRFPATDLERMRTLIVDYLNQKQSIQSIDLAVSSLGAGADLLFAREIIRRKIPLIIYIPFNKEQFISSSVDYLKSVSDQISFDWKTEFEYILNHATNVVFMDLPEKTGSSFAQCNAEILRFARSVAVHSLTAMALVRPGEVLREGGAAHFIEILKSENIPVQILWPIDDESRQSDISKLEKLIPLFGFLDHDATYNQNKWKKRLKFGLCILAIVAFIDAFVSVPDYFFLGNGQLVRMVALLISVSGVFLTLHLQISDKSSLSNWTHSRAKAEQIRSEIWFYLFDLGSESNRYGPYSETEFEGYLTKMRPGSWNGILIDWLQLIGLKQKMNAASLNERIDYYYTNRIFDQSEYFKRKSLYFQNRLSVYKSITYVFLIIAIIWGGLKLWAEFNTDLQFFMDLSPLGMMISFIALVTSYSEANNSKEMEYKYSQMAAGTELLGNRRNRINKIADFNLWVSDCEKFLRTQNNEWSLKREST
jgi:hypothetical protein